MSPKYVKGNKAQELLGVCSATLRQWANEGKISYTRSSGSRGEGVRYYDIESFIHKTPESTKEKEFYIYCRVSSFKQKHDLESQIKFLQEKYPNHTVIQDYGSGINFSRKGLRKILDQALQGNVSEIVLAHKDRLCRIAWDHFKWLFERLGVTVVVQSGEEHSPESELADDLFSIIHVFSSRHYGTRRGYTKKRTPGEMVEESAEERKPDSFTAPEKNSGEEQERDFINT